MKYSLIVVGLLLTACSASWHVRKAEKHIAIAESKGAKWFEKVKTDTIVKDTTIFIKGESLKDTFSINGADTIFITTEKIVTKLVVDCKNKKGSIDIKCPDNIVTVPQKYYVNRTITKSLKAGYSLFDLIGAGLLGAFMGLVIWLLVMWYKGRVKQPQNDNP
jgi:major membrane immunogen (membrane-anchored lipoprotein)